MSTFRLARHPYRRRLFPSTTLRSPGRFGRGSGSGRGDGGSNLHHGPMALGSAMTFVPLALF
jgi:hypothetical protein